MTQLNHIGRQLAADLEAARSQNEARQRASSENSKVHVVGAGAAVTAAYEQLRNAAEYTEEHVLLQRAIRRFYRRLFLLREEKQIAVSGEDLIIELTHAGYLLNDTVSESDVQDISRLASEYFVAYVALSRTKGVSTRQIEQWTYELLAVDVEWRLNNASQLQAFTQFAHAYFTETIEYEQLFGSQPAEAETALYVAIHRALLKSDDAVVRLGLLRRYRQSVERLGEYIETNKKIDNLFSSQTTDRLFRVVDRRGAPLRVLRHMVDEYPGLEGLFANRDQFLLAFEKQVNLDYEAINRRVNAGIIKSVVFLIITKFLIGIAIEVPYDYLVAGMILWVPLIINLLFPPVYMVLLRATMMLPGKANTARLVEQIDQTLYASESAKQLSRKPSKEFGSGYTIAYGLLFFVVFGGVAASLWYFADFDLVHLAIFFVFLSAASFLGFRLSRNIREIESIETHQNGVTLLRDFLYMPFVVVGRYLSDQYARVNIVALFLDMLIELPLKTMLRLVRQWAAFISAKKDQL
jgi:hypothetical protein